jgi:hypothetical protein
MPLLTVLFVLVIVGLVLYLVETYIPMSPPIKTVIRVLVVLFLCVWLLQLVGFVGPVIQLR